MKHTPTPWDISDSHHKKFIDVWGMQEGTDKLVATVATYDGELAKANAAHIVKCVNEHDSLVENLDYLKDLLEAIVDDAQGSFRETLVDAIQGANDTLAKARGEA